MDEERNIYLRQRKFKTTAFWFNPTYDAADVSEFVSSKNRFQLVITCPSPIYTQTTNDNLYMQ